MSEISPTTESSGLAEVDGGPIVHQKSIFNFLDRGLLQNPTGPAVVVMHQPAAHLSELVDHRTETVGSQSSASANGHLVWTYSQLHMASLKLTAGLFALGLEPRASVLSLIPNGVESLMLLWTASIARLSVAFLDYGALSRPRSEELSTYIRLLKPAAIFVPNSEGASAVEKALTSVDISRPELILLNGDSANKSKNLKEIAREGCSHDLDEASLLENARNDDSDRVAFTIFTSGTSSGKPKGCPRSVGATTQILHGTFGDHGLPVGAYNLLQTENFRVLGPTLTLATWKCGAAVVMPSSLFDPIKSLEAIELYGIQVTALLPGMVHAILSDPHFQSRNLDSVRSVGLCGDMITRDHINRAQTAFPKARIQTVHGMTEGGAIFKWIWHRTAPHELPFFGNISPLGTVNSGARVRIWDRERGQVAGRNEPGELHIHAASVIPHYLGHIKQEVFYDDRFGRWFNTEDLGMINNDGIIYILGRIRDVIKRAAVTITPAALENVINTFTGSETSVVAVASDLGEEPFAIVRTFGERTDKEIESHVLELFGAPFALYGVASLQQIGLQDFPLNATGKIVKREVQEALMKYLSSPRG